MHMHNQQLRKYGVDRRRTFYLHSNIKKINTFLQGGEWLEAANNIWYEVRDNNISDFFFF